MAHMDEVARGISADRVQLLLSVPIRWPRFETWAHTAWIRLDSYWTPEDGTAVLFARKMLQYGACLAVACQQGYNAQPGWTPGSVDHPGRLSSTCYAYRNSPLRTAAERPASLDCYAWVYDGMVRRKGQERRWYGRRARVYWLRVQNE